MTYPYEIGTNIMKRMLILLGIRMNPLLGPNIRPGNSLNRKKGRKPISVPRKIIPVCLLISLSFIKKRFFNNKPMLVRQDI